MKKFKLAFLQIELFYLHCTIALIIYMFSDFLSLKIE